MIEVWKDIFGFYGVYKVSNLGNVKSINYNHTKKEKILKPIKDRYGYMYVNLFKDGKIKKMRIHRLVAQAFVQNDSIFNNEINHKNENKEDNRASNLEFCTREYNINFGTHNEKVSKKLSRKVLCLETGVVYQGTRDVERKLGFSQASISRCCIGKQKTAYKFHWKYVD